MGGGIGVDVEIKQGKLDSILQSLKKDEKGFRATDTEVFCSYANIGSFLVVQGRQIVVDPAPGIDMQILRPYLLQYILGFLLHQRGLLVLHGSAVVLDIGAVAFLGASGSGKSTAAASLIKKGYSMIADDIVAIDTVGGVPVVYPAFPVLRLKPEVADSLGFELNKPSYAYPPESKLTARIDSCFSNDAVRLERIYLLEKGESANILRLGPQEATIELVRNSYTMRSLMAGANLSSHFSQCTEIAKDVPICRLVRPFDLKALTDFVQLVADDVRRDCCSTKAIHKG